MDKGLSPHSLLAASRLTWAVAESPFSKQCSPASKTSADLLALDWLHDQETHMKNDIWGGGGRNHPTAREEVCSSRGLNAYCLRFCHLPLKFKALCLLSGKLCPCLLETCYPRLGAPSQQARGSNHADVLTCALVKSGSKPGTCHTLFHGPSRKHTEPVVGVEGSIRQLQIYRSSHHELRKTSTRGEYGRAEGCQGPGNVGVG